MSTNSPSDDWLAPYVGTVVVCDLAEPYLVIGRLVAADGHHLDFADADLHDQREANSTKEAYALESRAIGVRVNRLRVAVPRRQLVAISRLEDL